MKKKNQSPWKPEQIQHCSITGQRTLFEVFSYNRERFTGRGTRCLGYADGWSKTLPHLGFFWCNFKHGTFIYSRSTSCTHVLIMWHDWWICFFFGHLCITLKKKEKKTFYPHFIFRVISCFSQQSWRSWFKCWVHVLHMCGLAGPGDPSKNLRHTCAGRSTRVMQSRWAVSSLASGHAPRSKTTPSQPRCCRAYTVYAARGMFAAEVTLWMRN